MRRAIRLARKAGDKARPNPVVGCVIADGNRIVGEGFHPFFGGPHAEAEALRRAGKRARGATAYVTLEPCCHTNKKSPPCVPALIHAGIRRAVVGMLDANPEVSGRGLRQLKRAGIRVTYGVLERECRKLNSEFFANTKKPRPYVILKAAASLDGRIETARGESQWITSAKARKAGHRIRSEVDAILVGIETVIRDNPRLTAHGAGRDPVRIVLDSRLRSPRRANILDGAAPTLIMTSRPTVRKSGGRKLGRAHLIYTPQNGTGLDLAALLRRLSGMGIGKILVEGGSRIHTSFLEAGLVDEVRLFLAPKLIGGKGARGFFEGRGIANLALVKPLSNVRVRKIGPDLLVTGKF